MGRVPSRSKNFSGINFSEYEFYSAMNLSTGWNIVPQWHNESRNFSILASDIGDSARILSKYDNKAKTFTSYVAGIAINANYTINASEPFFVYMNATSMIQINSSIGALNRTIYTGWNIFYNINDTYNISMINQSIGANVSIISYWNNTAKKYTSAVPKFSINHNARIPYLESIYIYSNQSINYTWER